MTTESSRNPAEAKAMMLYFTDLLGQGWEGRLYHLLNAGSVFAGARNVTTAEEAMAYSESLLSQVPTEEKDMIASYVKSMCGEGRNVVFLANPTIVYGNAEFHLFGARHQNVGSVNLFSLPLVRFRTICELRGWQEPEADAGSPIDSAKQEERRKLDQLFSSLR